MLTKATVKVRERKSGRDATSAMVASRECELQDKRASFTLRGGSPGSTYDVVVQGELSNGDILEEQFSLLVTDQALPPLSPPKLEKNAEPPALPVNPESSSRKPDGKFTWPGSGQPKSSRRVNAFGRGEGDRRKVTLAAIDIPSTGPPTWESEVDEAGAVSRSVPASSLILSRPHLVRGRLSSASRKVARGLVSSGDGISPILVTPHGEDKYVVIRNRGEHRVAAAILDNPRLDIPVLVAPRKRTEKQMDLQTPGAGSEWKKPAGVSDTAAQAMQDKAHLRSMKILERLIERGLDAAAKANGKTASALKASSRILPKLRQAARRAKPITQDMQQAIDKIHADFAAAAKEADTDLSTTKINTRKQESVAMAKAAVDEMPEMTEEHRRMGMDAKEQAIAGHNPPNWVADEDVWGKAKAAASKTYEESDDVFWPAVVSIYLKMGGTRKSEKSKIDKREMGMSMDEMHDAICKAVNAKLGANYYVNAHFPETQYVVVGANNMGMMGNSRMLQRVPYEINDDGMIELGEPEDVEVDYVPVKKSEVREYVADWDADGQEHVIATENQDEANQLSIRLTESCIANAARIVDNSLRFATSLKDMLGKRAIVKAAVEVEEMVGPWDHADEDNVSAITQKRIENAQILTGDDVLAKAAKKGIVTLLVYAPDIVDLQGEYATAEDVEDGAYGYMEKSRGRIKIQHKGDASGKKDEILVASWIQPNDWKLGNRIVKAGSWLVTVKLSPATKRLFDEGKLRGASMGGYCTRA